MNLFLYNTMTGSKEIFKPLDPKRITIYACGPTVYNRVHIGNARPAVVSDVLYRLLKNIYPEVIYARNITDIDDKIINAAKHENISIFELSTKYRNAYIDDMDKLNILRPTIEPVATDHIDKMIELIEKLISNGHAYVSNGNVLFSVVSMEDYGKLSKRKLDDMLHGARIDIADYKKHPGDFVLWKPSSNKDPGWDSPWGFGRPGWHIECSAMIYKHLGENIDIHCGGRDLIFPHHENEIAQSRCAHKDSSFVNYWIHNGYVNIDGEKMSKSLGNFKMVNELLTLHKGETLRYSLLNAHYRSELNFSIDTLDQAKSSLDSLYNSLNLNSNISPIYPEDISNLDVFKALLDDLNTPVALSELHKLSKKLLKSPSSEKPKIIGELLASGDILGVLQSKPDNWLKTTTNNNINSNEIENLISSRNSAKNNGDYEKADKIRNELLSRGILLEDGPDGTSWRIK
jgi:cysteinyl-tRNA synthetase